MIDLPVLSDGDLRLRIPGRRDVDPITRACQDPLIVRFTRVPYPYSRVHAQSFVRNADHELRAGIGVHLTIADADSDDLVGVTSLVLDHTRRSAEIGYWVAAEHRGRGVATRAVRLMSGFAFADLGTRRIELMADRRNLASQGVAERCGYRREGVLRSYEDRLGERIDYALYSLLPGELT